MKRDIFILVVGALFDSLFLFVISFYNRFVRIEQIVTNAVISSSAQRQPAQRPAQQARPEPVAQ